MRYCPPYPRGILSWGILAGDIVQGDIDLEPAIVYVLANRQIKSEVDLYTFFESTIGVFIPNSAVQNTISGSCWGSFVYINL